MQMTLCGRSLGIGAVISALALGAAWYGASLADRAAFTQALVATARCDDAGLVSITFADGGQFTCIPAEQIPPNSRSEAMRRQRRAGS